MAKHQVITPGTRFSRLVVLSHYNIGKTHWYVCRCDCGVEKPFRYLALRSGGTKSCGCLFREWTEQRKKVVKHGHARWYGKTRTYAIWQGIVHRCENPSAHEAPHYRDRGIKLCERWRKFENFLADMGPRPSPDHSVDRINNNGNYEPGNCRWATRSQQARNTSRTVWLTANGETRCLAEWAEILGISHITLRSRLNRGWSADKIVNTPLSLPHSHRRK